MKHDIWRVSPVLGVRRVRTAAEYYRDALGFDLDPIAGVFQPSPDEDGVYAIVERFGAGIHLQIRRGELPRRQRPPFERDVYLYVDDLRQLHAELLRRGARIVSPPAIAPHGILEMVVVDLDDHVLAFGQLQ